MKSKFLIFLIALILIIITDESVAYKRWRPFKVNKASHVKNAENFEINKEKLGIGRRYISFNSHDHHEIYRIFSTVNRDYKNYVPEQAFGYAFKNGLPDNSYIYNNFYGSQSPGRNHGFLANALDEKHIMEPQNNWANRYSNGRNWDDNDDFKWRLTTKSPYFENEIPGNYRILPASAVVRAATAFGLVSLLPLNVPVEKPLMYCNGVASLLQAKINLNSQKLFSCGYNGLEVSCLKGSNDDCKNVTMKCESRKEEIVDNDIYCKDNTVLSRVPIVCESSKFSFEDKGERIATIFCKNGELPQYEASFIPTTTQAPMTLTSKMHIFFLNLFMKRDDIVKMTPPPLDKNSELTSKEEETAWIPEPIIITDT